MMAGDRQYRLTIKFSVIQSIQEVNSTRARSGQADAKSTRILGVGTRHKCGCFFMPHLNKTNFVFPLAQRFH